MATTDGNIIETIVAAMGRRELGPVGVRFKLGADPTNQQIVLLPDKPGAVAVPIWRLMDGYLAYYLCELRLIALRHKMEAVSA